MTGSCLIISTKTLDWEREEAGRKNYALIITALNDIRKHMKKERKIDATAIRYALQNTLSIDTIYRALQKLQKENIVCKDEVGFYVNDQFLQTIDKRDIKKKTEYFVVYYYMIRYAVEHKHSIYIAYLASRLANYHEKKKWPKVMYTEYVHNLMECFFTSSEEHTMMRNLVKDKILIDRSYREKKDSWITVPVYEYNEKKVTELVLTHERAMKNISIKKLYSEEEQHDEQEEQSKAVVIEDVDKLREHATLDRVKSGSYTKEEIEEFKAKAEAGEIETF